MTTRMYEGSGHFAWRRNWSGEILRLAVTVLAIACMIAFGARTAAAQHIKVFVDGDLVNFEDVGPQPVDGRILVPVRGVLEKLGAMVDWAPETQRVNCSSGDIDIVLHIGQTHARVNGRDVVMDVPAQTIGGHTMVPLRFLSESLGAKVRWDGQEDTVFIMTRDSGSQTSNRPREYRNNERTRPAREQQDR